MKDRVSRAGGPGGKMQYKYYSIDIINPYAAGI